MMAQKTEISRGDILPMEQYVEARSELRRAVIAHKRPRRVDVGPVATFYFESYQTMLSQIHEMLFIEKGGEAQIADELHAYNPLVPKGRELVATVMFEIDDPVRRTAFLSKLGGVEETAFIRIGSDTIVGRPEADVDRTTAEGKASSVQFIHFPFSDAQVERFRAGKEPIVVGFTHPGYGHMTALSEETRAALAEDFA